MASNRVNNKLVVSYRYQISICLGKHNWINVERIFDLL